MAHDASQQRWLRHSSFRFLSPRGSFRPGTAFANTKQPADGVRSGVSDPGRFDHSGPLSRKASGGGARCRQAPPEKVSDIFTRRPRHPLSNITTN